MVLNEAATLNLQYLTPADGNGGAMFNDGGTLTVANSTFSSNHSTGLTGGRWRLRRQCF
jgi:hypothetical protein